MPITDTLKNAEDFRRTGFTEEQSNLLANKLEEVVQANNEDLKGFIRQQNEQLKMELRGEIRETSSERRAEFHESLKDLTIKILGVTIGVTIGAATVAVAVIKLFPNFY